MDNDLESGLAAGLRSAANQNFIGSSSSLAGGLRPFLDSSQQEVGDLTQRLRSRFGVPPPALRFFAETLAGDRNKITEQDFQPSELSILRDAAMRALAKGEKYMGYGDYAPGGEKSFKTWGGTEAAINALTDLPSSLSFTIGMGRVRQEPDGTIVINDKYDFNAKKNTVDRLKAQGNLAVARKMLEGLKNNGLLGIGNVIGNLVVPEDYGRDVEIRLPSEIPKNR